jgi:hypothetical protein
MLEKTFYLLYLQTILVSHVDFTQVKTLCTRELKKDRLSATQILKALIIAPTTLILMKNTALVVSLHLFY